MRRRLSKKTISRNRIVNISDESLEKIRMLLPSRPVLVTEHFNTPIIFRDTKEMMDEAFEKFYQGVRR